MSPWQNNPESYLSNLIITGIFFQPKTSSQGQKSVHHFPDHILLQHLQPGSTGPSLELTVFYRKIESLSVLWHPVRHLLALSYRVMAVYKFVAILYVTAHKRCDLATTWLLKYFLSLFSEQLSSPGSRIKNLHLYTYLLTCLRQNTRHNTRL